ncbi:MAG TPA: L,D-transpeptidase family protein [Anaerolineae bacterium]
MSIKRRSSPLKRPVAAQTAASGGAGRVTEAPTEVWVRPPQRNSGPWRGHRWHLLLTGMVIMAAMATLLALALGAVLFYHSNLIMPGSYVLGQQVGGRTRAEAADALQTRWQQRTITLIAGDVSRNVAPQDLGMALDTAATAEAAYQQGRSLRSLLDAIQAGGRFNVEPVWQLDLAVAEAYLQALAPEVAVAPVNAGVTLVNGRVEVTPPASGQALDVADTVDWLGRHAAQAVIDGRLPLAMKPVQPAITDTSAVAEKANQLLATMLTLYAYDPITDETITWSVPPDVWGGWLTLTVDPAYPGELDWLIDPEKAGNFFSSNSEKLSQGRYIDGAEATTAMTDAINRQAASATVRVYHHARQHAVQPGETLASIGRAYGIPYPWIQHANPGIGDSLSVGQTLTIPSPDELVPLPVVPNKRIVVSISQQKVWVYENGNLKWEWLASTGIDSSPTPPGVFQVQSHEPNAYAGNWNLWMPNFMGIYRPVPTSEFMNGFHGFPTRGSSQLLWTGDLGRRVTYGCILIHSDNAVALYDWAEEGVVVEIEP